MAVDVVGEVVDMIEMVSVAEEQSATVCFTNKSWRVCPPPACEAVRHECLSHPVSMCADI